MIPYFTSNGEDHYPFALWSTGYIELYFQWHSYKKPFDSDELRLEMLEKFNQIDGISLQKDDINKRPSIKFEVLAKNDNLDQFLEVIEWYMERVKKI